MITDYITIVIIILILLMIFYSVFYQLKDHFSRNDPIILELRKKLEKLNPEAKNVEIYIGDKSYIINKKKIYLCTKDKKNGKTYDQNTLFFVILHEFTHYICKSEIGHTPKFYEVFDFYLRKAEEMGFYDPNKPIPNDYCEL